MSDGVGGDDSSIIFLFDDGNEGESSLPDDDDFGTRDNRLLPLDCDAFDGGFLVLVIEGVRRADSEAEDWQVEGCNEAAGNLDG